MYHSRHNALLALVLLTSPVTAFQLPSPYSVSSLNSISSTDSSSSTSSSSTITPRNRSNKKCSRCSPFKKRNVFSWSLYSSSSSSSKQEIDPIQLDGVNLKQEYAKESLLKLVERQKRELRETEYLLERLSQEDFIYSNNDENNGFFNSSIGSDMKQQQQQGSNITSIAASVYSAENYGFVSRSEGCRYETLDSLAKDTLFDEYGPPANVLSLGVQQFNRNLDAIKGEYKDEEDIKLTKKQKYLQSKLKELTLNSTAIWEREESRGPIDAPFIIKVPYLVLCYLLDVVFEDRYVFSRFFLLETVARMPYFAYITMLHLYETLGFWRRSSDVKRVHFAEEWNEFHHLLIMESLGGDQAWWVRLVAQHSAILYYIGLSLLWAISPSLSYKFSELLETHAVDTYGQFVDENEEVLKQLPPTFTAIDYYTLGVTDPMLGEYQTSALAQGGEIRKSGINMRSLYDVFVAIRSDEGDHVGTMKACLDPKVAVLSPSLEKRVLTGAAIAASIGYVLSTGDLIDLPLDMSVAESVDDVVSDVALTDPIVDGVFGGVAAFLQGLKSVGEEDVEGTLVESELAATLLPTAGKLLRSLLEALGLLKFLG